MALRAYKGRPVGSWGIPRISADEQQPLKMIKIAVLLVVVAYVNAGLLVRTPQHDSAVIHSERHGGNFAYSTVEGHSYAHINPIVETVRSPVAVTYEHHPVAVPVVREHTIAYNAPVVATHPVFASHSAHPVFAAHSTHPVYASPSIVVAK